MERKDYVLCLTSSWGMITFNTSLNEDKLQVFLRRARSIVPIRRVGFYGFTTN